MSLALTPARLAAIYDCLRLFPPFNRLQIPPASSVHFLVSRTNAHSAAYTRYSGTDEHIIEVSEKRNGHFDTVASSVAHEMIHLSQRTRRTETPNTEHNAEFHQLAKLVCKRFGWDEKIF